MQDYGWRPRAREVGLVVQELGDESLVYDRDTDVAHCLTAVAARVWRGCDGQRDLAGLVEFAGASEELVVGALDQLQEKNLLAEEGSQPGGPDGVSRRQALGRIAKFGAGATAVPLIISAIAASPASAVTGAVCSGISVFSATAAKNAADAACMPGSGGNADVCNCNSTCVVQPLGGILCTCTGTCGPA